MIFDHYNYACVSDLEEFYNYREKAVTKQGLIKSVQNKHEKDDRPHNRIKRIFDRLKSKSKLLMRDGYVSMTSLRSFRNMRR